MFQFNPHCITSISDAEVEYEEQHGHFWHILYQVKETGARTYVLSNFQKTCFRVMQEHNVFLDDFDGRVISFECHLRKPQPEIYELLISRYQLDSAHSVFIDDMEVNVQAAKAAGLQTIHLPIGGFVLNYLEIVN